METRNLALDAQGGNRDAFSTLFEKVAPDLYVWASVRITNPQRSFIQPEDLLQETWTRALEKVSAQNFEETPFRPWLFAIARNVLLEALRYQRRQAERIRAGGRSTFLTYLDRRYDEATRLTQRLARDEELETMRQKITALSEDEQKLVLYIGLEQLSMAEAAERLEISADAVSKRWQRLRGRLNSK